eukprot:TCONS_00054281-protein
MQHSKTLNIIAGLGNHFAKHSRHSVGMRICDSLAKKHNLSWSYERKYKAFTTALSVQDHQFILFKSKWPMNLNGRSLEKIVSDLSVDINKVTVLHDELDRNLGKCRWKLEGSANGHNGVKSVIQSLKTDKFRRLRIGIGRPINKSDVVDYVLSDFTAAEEQEFFEVATRCIEMLRMDVFPDEVVEVGQKEARIVVEGDGDKDDTIKDS